MKAYFSGLPGDDIMTAIAQAISRVTGTEIDVDSLSAVLIFCGIGLTVSLFAIEAYGLDLSCGFF
jgi:hypothetical protein